MTIHQRAWSYTAYTKLYDAFHLLLICGFKKHPTVCNEKNMIMAARYDRWGMFRNCEIFCRNLLTSVSCVRAVTLQ